MAGIQVKPQSYFAVQKNVQVFNTMANARYGKPVFYAVYDYDSEALINLDEVVQQIKSLA